MSRPSNSTPVRRQPSSNASPRLSSLCVLLLLLVVTGTGWYATVFRQPESPEVVMPPQAEVSPVPPPVEQPVVDHRPEFFANEIAPLLEQTMVEDFEATERAIQRLEQSFETYRAGIVPFAEDLTSFRTRMIILRRMPGDWWRETNRAAEIVRTKLEQYVVSEVALKTAIEETLQGLKQELEGNQNRLQSQVRAAYESSGIPTLVEPDYTAYEAAIRAELLQYAVRRGKDSVYQGIATLIASEVTAGVTAGLAARITSQILTQVASSAAVASATNASATAGTAGGGAVAGSSVGPAGTVVGLGVGLVIGIVVDWWLAERFEAKLITELTNYLNLTESALLDGASGQPGLRGMFEELAVERNQCRHRELRRAILGTVEEPILSVR